MYIQSQLVAEMAHQENAERSSVMTRSSALSLPFVPPELELWHSAECRALTQRRSLAGAASALSCGA